jgi:hypothetical protein
MTTASGREVILDTIAATTTAAGLTVTAHLDIGRYPLGAAVSDEQMKELEDRVITRHGFHGDWNYANPRYFRTRPADCEVFVIIKALR